MQVKADLHVHSTYSADSVITPKELVFYAKKRGLTAVAVTDHNQLEGARKISAETDFLIIPGTEISSLGGHIVGLNLDALVPRGLSADETVDRIHSAGGVAIACHPYAWLKGSVGKYVTKKFDAVETRNATSFPFKNASRKAEALAQRLRLPRVAGTDAHIPESIGLAYTLLECEPDAEAILKAIVTGHCKPMGGPIPMSVRIKNQLRFLKKVF